MKKTYIISLLVILTSGNIFSQSGWVQIYDSFSFYTKQVDFVNENTGFIICNDGKILKSTNSGMDWGEVNPGFNVSINYFQFTDQNTGYFSCNNGRIMKTTDQGLSFSEFNTMTNSNIEKVEFINDSVGVAFCWGVVRGKLFRTSDYGNQWNTTYEYIQGLQSNILDLEIVDEQTIFLLVEWNNSIIGGGSTIVKKSTDGGYNFVNLYSTNTNHYNLNFLNANIGLLTGNLVARTTNSGNNWIPIPTIYGISGEIVKLSNGKIFSGSYVGYGWTPIIYSSLNYGLNWDTSLIVNSTQGGFRNVDFHNDLTGWALEGRIGTNGILYKTTNGGNPVGLNLSSTQIPQYFSLYQNYPNPFNPVTNIRFDIPAFVSGGDRFVKLIIYDLLGREVATLVNEQLKPGSYEVDWDGSGFASGLIGNTGFCGDEEDGFVEVILSYLRACVETKNKSPIL